MLRLNFSRGVGRMMRVKASSLQELAKLVAEKLKVELPDDGAADVSMLEPGRKVPSPALTPSVDPLAETELQFGGVLQEPTFVTSLDQVPAKAKVQLWSKGTAPSSDPPAAGSSYTLTVTKSEAVRPNNPIETCRVVLSIVWRVFLRLRRKVQSSPSAAPISTVCGLRSAPSSASPTSR